jgi:hypothetical protein
VLTLISVLAACLPAPGGGGNDSAESGSLVVAGTISAADGTDGVWAGAVVGLVDFTPDRDAPLTGDVLVATEPLGTDESNWSLTLPATPPDDGLQRLDGDLIAIYMLAAWVDSDADGELTPADQLVGARTELWVWAGEEPTGTLADAGVGVGWNRVDYQWWLESVPAPDVTAVGASGVANVAIQTNLLPFEPGDLSGQVAGPAALADTVVLVDYVGACEGVVEGETYASGVVSGAQWSIPLPAGGPPERSYYEPVLDGCDTSGVPIWGVEGALHGAVAIVDTDGDGVLDPGEQELADSAGGGQGWLIVYLRPTGIEAAAYTELGGSMGWNAVEIGGLGLAGFVSWDDDHNIY